MTLTDVADTGSKKPVEPTTGDRELLLDYTKRVADQPSRRADQERGMDLDSEAEDRAPIPVADNACPSTVVNGAMDEENFRPVVEGEQLTLAIVVCVCGPIPRVRNFGNSKTGGSWVFLE